MEIIDATNAETDTINHCAGKDCLLPIPLKLTKGWLVMEMVLFMEDPPEDQTVNQSVAACSRVMICPNCVPKFITPTKLKMPKYDSSSDRPGMPASF